MAHARTALLLWSLGVACVDLTPPSSIKGTMAPAPASDAGTPGLDAGLIGNDASGPDATVDAPGAGAEAGPPVDGRTPAVDAGPDAPASGVPDAGLDGARDTPSVVRLDTAPAACGKILLVVGTENTAADGTIRQRLAMLGCTVVVQPEASLSMADTAGASLVVVSETVPAKPGFGSSMKPWAVPILTLEAGILVEMGMAAAGGVGGTNAQSVAIIAAGHPLAGGLSGTIAIATSPVLLGWGKPGAAGIGIASLVGQADHLVLFAYERGAAMADGVAPARRVYFGAEDMAVGSLGSNGWTLFDAAVEWGRGAR